MLYLGNSKFWDGLKNELCPNIVLLPNIVMYNLSFSINSK